MFEDDVLVRDELVLEDLENRQSVPAPRGPSFKSEKQDATARVPPPHKSPAKESASPIRPEAAQEQVSDKERRKGFLHRRPVVSAIGAVLLASAIAGGYLYTDYAKHFESTDDAFIAARQSALAPKVSGYITAVPVTRPSDRPSR